jgi:hypothetical protein
VQRIGELQERLDVAPQLEAELAGLTRDYEVLRSQYEGLLQRRELMNFEIDRKRQGKQLEFRIIEPPFAQQQPVAPERAGCCSWCSPRPRGGRRAELPLAHAAAGVHFRPGDLRGTADSGAGNRLHGLDAQGEPARGGAPSCIPGRPCSLLLGVFGGLFTRLPEITDLVQRLMS